MFNQLKPHTTLPLLGVIPFVAGSLGLYIDYNLQFIHVVLSAYALMIVSFMAGVHWGQHLSIDNGMSKKLALSSNVIALMASVGFFALPFHVFYLLAAVLLLVILIVDLCYKPELGLCDAYKKTRIIVTTIAAVSLSISFGLGVMHG